MNVHFHIFHKLHIYITTCRMKKRQLRDNSTVTKENRVEFYDKVIKPLKERSGGKCEFCGRENKRLYVHHVLPFSHFPEYYKDLDNMLYICNSCHNMIHTDPFLECSMIEDMAIKKKIKLQKHYRICGRILQ